MTQRFVSISQLIKEIQERLNPLRLSLAAMQEERHAYLIDQFNKAGGCKVCGGRGWIVTWDTMDYMDGSCAEYGICTNSQCTEASRKRTGCFPKESKYDKFRKGYTDPMLDPAWQRIIEPITKQINDLDSAMKSAEQLQRTPFKYGDHVRQVRGRKLALRAMCHSFTQMAGFSSRPARIIPFGCPPPSVGQIPTASIAWSRCND